METQATARTALHGGVAGRRSQGVMETQTARGMTGGDDENGGGAHSADRGPRRWCDAEGPGR